MSLGISQSPTFGMDSPLRLPDLSSLLSPLSFPCTLSSCAPWSLPLPLHTSVILPCCSFPQDACFQSLGNSFLSLQTPRKCHIGHSAWHAIITYGRTGSQPIPSACPLSPIISFFGSPELFVCRYLFYGISYIVL